MAGWRRVERFSDLQVGQLARLVRPYTEIPDDDEPGGVAVVTQESYQGVVEYLNPRGELRLKGYRLSFLEDATFGEWFYEVYVYAGWDGSEEPE